MSLSIPRDQVISCLEAAGWKFTDQTKRVLLFRKAGSAQRVVVPKRDLFPEEMVRIVLSQAKFSHEQIKQFLKDAVPS
jgi:predicted RNA binding protein YcfA (HicA-like mRNA interferase family)